MTHQVDDTRGLGRLIRERRKHLGLTQADVAMVANVGVRFVVDIENGKESCRVGLAIRLMQTLGLSLLVQGVSASELEEDNMPGGLDVGDDEYGL